MHVLSKASRLATVLAVFFIAGCGGGGSSSTPATSTPATNTPATISIGGSVTGPGSGVSVTLLDNGSDSKTVSTNGSFTFPTPLATGATYSVTVGTQPSNQVCHVTNGSGTVGSANVTNVQVTCFNYKNFAYVANGTSNNVSAYSINATTGALTQVTGSPFPAGSTPSSVTVNPAGTFAYVTNQNSSNVSAYSINATTGALTQVAGSPFTAGTNPYSVVTF